MQRDYGCYVWSSDQGEIAQELCELPTGQELGWKAMACACTEMDGG